MSDSDVDFSITDLYLAYRKAKAEAFYENTHFHALAYADYENRLERNLAKLLKTLNDRSDNWPRDLRFVGSYGYLPKSLDPFDSEKDAIFFRHLDPVQEWERQWRANKRKRAPASFHRRRQEERKEQEKNRQRSQGNIAPSTSIPTGQTVPTGTRVAPSGLQAVQPVNLQDKEVLF